MKPTNFNMFDRNNTSELTHENTRTPLPHKIDTGSNPVMYMMEKMKKGERRRKKKKKKEKIGTGNQKEE